MTLSEQSSQVVADTISEGKGVDDEIKKRINDAKADIEKLYKAKQPIWNNIQTNLSELKKLASEAEEKTGSVKQNNSSRENLSSLVSQSNKRIEANGYQNNILSAVKEYESDYVYAEVQRIRKALFNIEIDYNVSFVSTKKKQKSIHVVIVPSKYLKEKDYIARTSPSTQNVSLRKSTLSQAFNKLYANQSYKELDGNINNEYKAYSSVIENKMIYNKSWREVGINRGHIYESYSRHFYQEHNEVVQLIKKLYTEYFSPQNSKIDFKAIADKFKTDSEMHIKVYDNPSSRLYAVLWTELKASLGADPWWAMGDITSNDIETSIKAMGEHSEIKVSSCSTVHNGLTVLYNALQKGDTLEAIKKAIQEEASKVSKNNRMIEAQDFVQDVIDDLQESISGQRLSIFANAWGSISNN